jgi:hypothetical protein
MSIRMIPRSLGPVAITICLQLLAAAPARAQRTDAGWHSTPLRAPSWITVPSSSRWSFVGTPPRDSTRIPRTYWLEGAGILGATSAIFGAYLGAGLCHYYETCRHPGVAGLEGFLMLGVVGFGVGALIGGQFPRS